MVIYLDESLEKESEEKSNDDNGEIRTHALSKRYLKPSPSTTRPRCLSMFDCFLFLTPHYSTSEHNNLHHGEIKYKKMSTSVKTHLSQRQQRTRVFLMQIENNFLEQKQTVEYVKNPNE